MSENKVLSFIAQIRASGAKGQSVIITIPREIVEILKLEEKDYCKFMIEKIMMKQPVAS